MDPALSSSSLGDILASIDVSPEIFLQPSASLQAASLVAAKRILDPVVQEYSVFHELALKGLDVEQVWEQVRLVGDEVKRILDKEAGLKGQLRKAINGNGNHHDHEDNSSESETDYEDEYAEDEEQSEEDGVEDEDMVDDEDASANDEENVTADEFPTNPELDEESDEEVDSATTSQPKQFKKDVHGLNDEFFSIDDFNRLTEQQDNSRSDDENEDDIDYFGDPDEQNSEDEEENPDEITYQDFYLPPPNSNTASRKRKRAHFENDEVPAEDELDDEARTTRFQKDLFADTAEPGDSAQPKLSTHAKRQVAIRAEVDKLEQENITGKQWMYVGEASSRDRPKNSLLELAEQLDVERSTKPVPIVTEDRTRSLEEIIKQRIVDNLFDDVIRKLPPSITQKSRPLDDPDMQEPGAKPTRGLAEIYEQEHLRRIDPTNNPTPLAMSLQKQHAEIDELWKSLSHQLDSLTSWRFIPAPEVGDERVVANIPAVEMEDARPEAEAGATMLAPQEVYRPEAKKGEVVVGGLPVARVEMTREEKARERKREGQRREKKILPPVEGGKRDVIDTLKRGGVKIISHGQGRGRGRGSSRGRGQMSRGGGRIAT